MALPRLHVNLINFKMLAREQGWDGASRRSVGHLCRCVDLSVNLASGYEMFVKKARPRLCLHSLERNFHLKQLSYLT